MEVAKLSAPPNLEVRSVSCNESAIRRWLSSELEDTVFSLTHELSISTTENRSESSLQLLLQQGEIIVWGFYYCSFCAQN